MAKFFGVLCFALIVACVGEYFYFQNKLNQWQASTEDWRRAAYDSEQALNPLKIQLENCQDRPDSSDLAKELIACRKRCPDSARIVATPTPRPAAEYADWPEFLQPRPDGTIEIIDRYYKSELADLNSFLILSYGDVSWNTVKKCWEIVVQHRGTGLDHLYRIYTDEFCFRDDGALYKFENLRNEPYSEGTQ